MPDAAMPYNPEIQPASGVDLVIQTHQAMLLAKPGVTGVSTGQSEIGDPAVVVYLIDRSYASALPETLDGVPVTFQVTGPIVARSSS
jgi:hypothetical protein